MANRIQVNGCFCKSFQKYIKVKNKELYKKKRGNKFFKKTN